MRFRLLVAAFALAGLSLWVNSAMGSGKDSAAADPQFRETTTASTPASVPAAAPTSQPTTAPVVAIVYRKLQDTKDKAADEIANKKIIDEMVAEAIELSGGLSDMVKDGQSVVLKPNLTNNRYGKYMPGMTTDVRVASAVVDALNKAANCKITIAEGSGPAAAEQFRICGYDKLAEKHKIPLVDMAEDKTVEVLIPDALSHESYQLPKCYMDADVAINVPCLKTNALTGITLSMKNYFGLLPNPRPKYHGDIENVLVDLARARKTSLVVVDGLVGMEGEGPLWGNSVPVHVVIAGRDMVAVDTVATMVMGFDPKLVLHIQKAAEMGVGVADPAKIVIKGTPIDKVKRTFADSHWSFTLTCPKTDANMKKLHAMPNKRPISGWNTEDRGKVVGWEAYLDKGVMTYDRQKHPEVVDCGFSLAFNKWDDKIHVVVPYRSLHRADIPVLKEAVQKWIVENMETAKPTTAPGAVPQQGEDIDTMRKAEAARRQAEKHKK